MKKKTILLTILLICFAGLASSNMVINSGQWQDTALGISMSHFQGEEVNIVSNLGEGQLIESQLNESQTHTVYESQDKAVWQNYGTYLQNNGKQIEKRQINWEETQYKFYDNVSDKVKGFIVVKPEYGFDTISVFPKVIKSDYYLLYYQREKTTDFLKDKEKPITFYGEYTSQPWLKLQGKDVERLSKKDRASNNKQIVSQLIDQYKEESVTVAGDSYIEKGFLKKGAPVVLSQEIEETAELIQNKDIRIVQVIGAENVNFGNSLKDRLDNVSVIAKFGRRFTGNEGLSGTYPIKKIPVKPIVRDITLNQVTLDYKEENESKVAVQFENKGTIPTRVNVSALQLEQGEQTTIISQPKNIIVREQSNASIQFKSNLTFNASNAEVSYDYKGNDGITTENYQIKHKEIPKTQVRVEDLYYSETREKIILKIRNQGDTLQTADGRLKDVKILNKTLTLLSEDRKELEPREKTEFTFNARFTGQELEKNKEMTAGVISNSETGSPAYSEAETVEMKVRKENISAEFYKRSGMIAVIILIILVLAALMKREKLSKKFSEIR